MPIIRVVPALDAPARQVDHDASGQQYLALGGAPNAAGANGPTLN